MVVMLVMGILDSPWWIERQVLSSVSFGQERFPRNLEFRIQNNFLDQILADNGEDI